MTPVPLAEIERRLAAFQAGLISLGVDAALLIQPVDLYYFTGTLSQGHLVVPAEGEPLLLVRRDRARSREESPLTRIVDLDSLRDLPAALRALGLAPTSTLGMELDVVPVLHFRRYEGLFPQARIVDCSLSVRAVRAVKSALEIACLEEAAKQVAAVMEEAAGFIRPGMTELEVSARVEGSLRREGHQGIMRFRAFGQEMVLAHVLAGPEAAMGSYMDAPLGGRGLTAAVAQGAGRRPIQRHEPIVMDIGGAFDGYIVDQTRTLCIGAVPDDFRAAYDACLEIHHLVRHAAVPGVAAGDIYDLAVTRATDLGYADSFMGARPSQVGFIGHGIGLEIDEFPLLARGDTRTLELHHVVAVEPKIVFKGRGAVGIEDTCEVTPSGLRPITTVSEALWEL